MSGKFCFRHGPGVALNSSDRKAVLSNNSWIGRLSTYTIDPPISFRKIAMQIGGRRLKIV